MLREAARLEREYPMQKIEAAQFENFFERRLEIYSTDKKRVVEEATEQDNLLKRVQEANAAFLVARKGDTSTKQREQALQSLENAYFKYKEIISNLEAGRKFYNDLAKIVSAFRDECRNFAYQRRAEAAQMEMYVPTPEVLTLSTVTNLLTHLRRDLSSAMSSLNLNTAASLHQQKQAESRSSTYHAGKPPIEVPLAAPQPTRTTAAAASGMWTPDAGIRFGTAPASQNGAASGPGGATGGKTSDGRWDPSKGMKFS